jgi:malonyl-CoA reductase / 3-hydroxypropionate dehydrogenase (NADP+)
MPTETEVALATVYFLADRAVSGETFMPSGGLSLERSITERELFGSAKRERLDMMRGRTVWLIGEHLVEYLAEAARQLVTECQVGRVVLLTRTAAGADAICTALRDVPPDLLHTVVTGDDIEGGIDLALAGTATRRPSSTRPSCRCPTSCSRPPMRRKRRRCRPRSSARWCRTT